MNCYNCGIKLDNLTNHVEHIPAKNLFNTLPEEYKQQLITVPSCFNCNNQFSKIDQEIRDAVGISNEDNDLLNEVTRKSVKSIVRRKDWKERVTVIEESKLYDVQFNYNTFSQLHVKNFKGLIYHHYKLPLSNIYSINLVAEGDEEFPVKQQLRRLILSLCDDGTKFQFIGHQDVFKYKLKKLYLKGNDFTANGNKGNEIGFIGVLIYYNKLRPVLIATKNNIFKYGKHKGRNY